MTAASSELRYWVEMALECVRRDHTSSISVGDQRGPFLTARAQGMALAALNDAWALAVGGTTLLTLTAPGLSGLTDKPRMIAAAAACHQLLRERYPKQAMLLDAGFRDWLARHELGPAGSSAEIAGRAFGLAVHSLGLNDSADAALGRYTPPSPPVDYAHRAPDNEPKQGYAGGAWGDAKPLVLTSHIPFPGPPGRTAASTVIPTTHFKDDFAKVADRGFDDRSRGRTAREEFIGIAWGYDGPPELGTPPRLYMQVVLTILDCIEARKTGALSVDEELAIIAGCAVAMADAGIEAWHYKYSPLHMMWRPVIGIQHAVPPNGTPIPGWLPLGRPDTNQTGANPAAVRIEGTGLTPDFPAYPSGHATFGAAAFHTLRLFLVEKGQAQFKADGRDNIDFDFVSDEYNGRNTDPRNKAPRARVVHRYESLWEAIVDNSVSRVFLGVHWQFDGITTRNAANTDDEFGIPTAPNRLGQTGGVWLGGEIAKQIATRLNVSAATIGKGKM